MHNKNMKNIVKKSLFLVVLMVVSAHSVAQEFTFSNSTLPAGWSATGKGSSKFSDETPVLKIPTGETLTYTFDAATNLTSIDFVYSFGSKNAGIYVTLTAKGENGSTLGTAQLAQETQQSGSNVRQEKNLPFVFNGVKSIVISNETGKNFLLNYVKFNSGAATPVVSTDATLSGLTYNGTSVPNFSASQTSYDVELPAGTTAVPTVAATANESHATVAVTPASAIPGTASVLVTAEDGTTTKTYTINFSVASAYPKVLTATWPNIQGTAVIDNISTKKTITGQVKNGTGLTAITPTFTGNNINTWMPEGPQNFSNGEVEYIFSGNGPVEYYYVTITEAAPMSSDATLSSLTYGGTSVPNFSANTYVYNIELTNGLKTPPTISAVANDSKANVAITQAGSVPGSGTVVVTAEDGTQLTYTINYTVPVPQSGLTIHVPEIYEAKEIAGGYNTPLKVDNGREYEVYYFTRDANSEFCVATTAVDKAQSISTKGSTDFSCRAKDGWFTFDGCAWSSSSDAMGTEFGTMVRRLDMDNTSEFNMRIQGFDQFSIVAKDKKKDTSSGQTKPDDNRYLEVYIDDVLQAQQFNTSPSIRRYDVTTQEHVIRIIHHGNEKSSMYAFSLRVAQEPRTKWLNGNDSTQVVMQTSAIKPITYVTKYNNIPGAETRLEWNGTIPTGIQLTKTEGTLTDTLTINGNANCPTGIYEYAVVAYYNGVETSRATGKIKVASDIQATSPELNVKVYQGEEMDQITFKYFALSADDVQLTWPNGQPTGITGNGNNGKYIIGGTPTITGTFPFSITVTGAETTIQGSIEVETLVYGDKAVLFLYKNSYTQDAVYNYIQNKHQWNLIARKQKEDGLRPTNQYANYKWILISEDADANNEEVIAIIKNGGANLPVLNLKGFTYSSDRLNWGEPNNGAVDSTSTKNKGSKLYIQQANHPIFKSMNLKNGDSIKILSDYATKGIMPVDVKLQGSLCLATGYTRSIEDYYGYGEMQTALHEVPAEMRGGHKYICLPLAQQVTLSPLGQNLIDGIISYLTSPNTSGIEIPLTQINRFAVGEHEAVINQTAKTITLTIPEDEYDQLEQAKPIVELADPTTHLTPSIEPYIDLRYAAYIPYTFVVTDYINRTAYSLTVETYNPHEDIEEVYEAGMWVNVYDIYGRKVATTNENVYTMELPQGMYIIVTESGKTIKIMR